MLAPSVSLFTSGLRIGDIQQYRNLACAPLMLDSRIEENPEQYGFITEALTQETLSITETTTQDPSVHTLDVDNSGQEPVFAPAGTYLEGGGQDRMIAVSIVILPRCKGKLPAYCVEAHRWNPTRGRKFKTPKQGTLSGATLAAGIETQQYSIWDTIDESIFGLQTHSGSSRLGDVLEQSGNQLEPYLKALKLENLPDRAVGMASVIYQARRHPFFIKMLRLLDVFGSGQLFQKVYEGLLESVALSAATYGWQNESDSCQLETVSTTMHNMLMQLRSPEVEVTGQATDINRGQLLEGRASDGSAVTFLVDQNYLVHAMLRG